MLTHCIGHAYSAPASRLPEDKFPVPYPPVHAFLSDEEVVRLEATGADLDNLALMVGSFTQGKADHKETESAVGIPC